VEAAYSVCWCSNAFAYDDDSEKLGFFSLFFKAKERLYQQSGVYLEQQQKELNGTLFSTYVFIVKAARPVGPRDLMRGAGLSSPSVAYRNLQRLTELGLVDKDEYGNYIMKKKVGLSGYVWVGRKLLPRFAIFGLIFVCVLVAEIAVLIPHLMLNSPIEESFWLLTIVTVVAAVIFLVEGLRYRKKVKV
jgi:DNA-binding transcriptional ArsR family regulator